MLSAERGGAGVARQVSWRALWAAALYLLAMAVALLVSFAVSSPRGRPSLGVIMEMPPMRQPYPALVMKKLWFLLREFVVVARPVPVVSSIVLSALSNVGWMRWSVVRCHTL